MGWSIGYDSVNDRDIGYGVPAYCDHPDCMEEIDRGLGYRCGDIHDDDGCGLFFCGEHSVMGLCERCEKGEDPFEPSDDHPTWTHHKNTHHSWKEWRKENVK